MLPCHLEHVHNALLVDGTATTKKENIGNIFSVADALLSWRNYRYHVSVSVSVLTTAMHLTVLNVSRLLTAGKCFSNYRHDSLLRN